MASDLLLFSRRNCLKWATASTVAGLAGFAGHAEEPIPPVPGSDTGAEFITAETQSAIDRGLAFLARIQNDDGSFTDRSSGISVGVSALAGLALMAGGNQPGRGRYGKSVSRLVDFLLASGNGPIPGFLAGNDGMIGFRGQNQPAPSAYSHAFGCLFLSEVCGMLPEATREKRVKGLLEQAVAYTVAGRNKEGGWRYEQQPPVADVSVTVAQMMALRAAKNAGILIRKSVVEKGVEFIRNCQKQDGGFSYQIGLPGTAFARSAAAIVGLYSAGIYTGRDIERGLKYIHRYLPGQQFARNEVPPQHYFYGHYYAALAMWTAGGEYWSQWFPAIRDELLARLRSGGSNWSDSAYGPAYATAMSLIVLQLPNNYLPILQK